MQCFCGNSSVGRASASQAEGRGFESRFPLKRTPEMRASQQRCLFLCVASPGSLLPGRKTHKKKQGQQSCPALILHILLKAPPRRAGRECTARRASTIPPGWREWRRPNPAASGKRMAEPQSRGCVECAACRASTIPPLPSPYPKLCSKWP